MKKQLEHVRKFLHGWMLEIGPNGYFAPSRVDSLWSLTFDKHDWDALQDLDSAVEDWAIELGVNTTPVDEAHPDAPWGDNLVRKLMVIRGSII